MSRRLLITFVALVGMAMQGWAQLSVVVPVWEKFAFITTAGVNLRKAPNANSPKLYSKDESWGHEIHIDYSWSPRSGYTPHRLEVGTILPIVAETDEWYCLYLGNFEDIYIMKKFCSLVYPISATNDEYSQCGREGIKGSNGYLLGLYFFGSAVVDPYVRIGHKVGKFVIGADYGEECVDFVEKYHDEELGYPNVEKIKEVDLIRFLKSHQPQSTYDIWIKFSGRRNLNCFRFNADKYQYEKKSLTY